MHKYYLIISKISNILHRINFRVISKIDFIYIFTIITETKHFYFFYCFNNYKLWRYKGLNM